MTVTTGLSQTQPCRQIPPKKYIWDSFPIVCFNIISAYKYTVGGYNHQLTWAVGGSSPPPLPPLAILEMYILLAFLRLEAALEYSLEKGVVETIMMVYVIEPT